jgi:hypothetical protein
MGPDRSRSTEGIKGKKINVALYIPLFDCYLIPAFLADYMTRLESQSTAEYSLSRQQSAAQMTRKLFMPKHNANNEDPRP